jgi:tetratricopeptide (TPR) repeat protein
VTEPIRVTLDEATFDVALLPAAARAPATPAFRRAVAAYFERMYAPLGGTVDVEFADGRIVVVWRSAESDRDPMGGIIELLSAGRYAEARPMLEALLRLQPDDADVLYNLGMVYSDEGRLDAARDLLRRAVRAAPDRANAYVALGVAALRAGDPGEAEPTLIAAVDLEPHNPFALRTLGTLRLMQGDAAGAIGWLRRAVAEAPGDPVALLTLAQALIEADLDAHAGEADDLLTRVLAVSPHGEIAEKAQDARHRIAEQAFRETTGGALRVDAVNYCLGALRTFDGLSRTELAPILMEVAALGQKGLPVNDAKTTFRLRSLPGEFTALHLVCLLHVGMRQLDPAQGSGFDIEREYQAAVALHRGGTAES